MSAIALQDIAGASRWLRSPAAIRSRCRQLFDAGLAGELSHFHLDLERLDAAATIVVDVTRAAYPDLDIPYHSRWRHFAAGGIDRWEMLAQTLGDPGRRDLARLAADLAIVSVLLDAGAGDRWRYRERETGNTFSRSEGLAVASLRMFEAGAFSERGETCTVDAGGLENLDAKTLARCFQVDVGNPLVGLEARVALLRGLGRALRQRPDVFGANRPRFGNLLDHLSARSADGTVSMATVLTLLLETLASIWPSGTQFHGINIGDVGQHEAARADDLTDGLVPFHKLTQWLAYSLIEPLEWSGAKISDMDALTGLPEYRNGGLFVDCRVLRVEPRSAPETYDPRSKLVVEWRALTIVLLDLLAERVRQMLGCGADRLPLARLLQGGTWAAGRRLAFERHPSGAPPILVATDGTTF
jgi:Protein of unknown function (DUF1688)